MRKAWTTPIGLALGALLAVGSLAGLGLVVDLASAGPAQALGILPPADPTADLAPSSAALTSCQQPGGLQSVSCEQDVLSQINHARASEGLGPMTLPSDYLALSAADQLLVVVALERSARGLPVPAGLVALYDQSAAQGANAGTDPPVPQGYANYGSILAQGVYSVLLTDFEWMYDDGYGSNNVACSAPSAPACWVHRNVILGAYSAGSHFYMGAAMGAGQSPVYAAVLASTNQSLPVVDSYQPSASSPSNVALTRLAGPNRDLTAVAVSQNAFPTRGTAKAVVLATDAGFPDALAGAPLAVAKDAPLLLTTPTALDPVVGTEITRVLPKGGPVYILGGSTALAQVVSSRVQALGYTVIREAGPDRFATARSIAGALGDPSTVFLADATGFADALVAGPAAAKEHGAVLLTNGGVMNGDTAAYLSAHPGSHYAVGAQAQAADPQAGAVGGADHYSTSVAVAQRFFATTRIAGFASGATYPDELSGDAHIGAKGGPMILLPPTGALAPSISSYLSSSAVTGGYLYGGTGAVSAGVASEVAAS